MKKWFSLVCAAMLCTCCLALAACGGSSSGSGSAATSGSAAASEASASEEASAPAEVVDPTAAYIGDWQLAGAESQGMTIAGDFGTMLGADNIKITLNEGGTGSTTYGETTRNFTWAEDGQGIALTMEAADEASASAESASAEASESAESASAESASAESAAETAQTPTSFVLEGDVLTGTIESNGDTVKMLFTRDGKLAGTPDISSASATPITDAAALVGDWKLSGMNMMGVMMYGDADNLATMAGGVDMSMSFKDDGTCTMSGEDATYSVDADGAFIESGGMKIPVMALGDNLVIDMGDLLGSALSSTTNSDEPVSMVLMYSK